MANEFSGAEAVNISGTVKRILRDYLSDKLKGEPYAGSYRAWDGVAVKVADEVEGEELPQEGRPTVTIRTRSKTQETGRVTTVLGNAPVKATTHKFLLEVRVLADADTGAVASENESSADSLLSDHIDAILRPAANRLELRALGLHIGPSVERIESGPDEDKNGLHINTHVIPCEAVTLDE